MGFKSQLARGLGRASRWGLQTFTQGGSSLPGKLALSIDPNILDTLAQNYDIAVITGTNGKTLTTALTNHALSQKYDHVLTNPTGSNMQQGIVSTFLDAKPLQGNERGIAVLEVDEGSLKHVVKALKPKVFLHTNVFADQLDRYGEIDAIYQFMADAAIAVPEATVISNADSPMLNTIDLPNDRLFFGFDHEKNQPTQLPDEVDDTLCPRCDHVLSYTSHTYANLGNYACANCRFKRPELDFKVDSLERLAVTDSTFTIDGHTFSIPVAGLYNIYNALAAYSLARFFGLNPEQIEQGFTQADRVFGRQETFNINSHKVTLNLVKNPVGLNQVIDLVGLDKEPFTLVSILNNNYADGTDINWIWEGNFEKMQAFPIKSIITSGMKADDMTRRLKEAHISTEPIQQVSSLEDVITAIEETNTENVHILSTYTAMLDLRKLLIEKGYIEE